MKGNSDVIVFLNELLTHELTSINQYFIHARMCENWGYERLWHMVRDEAIDEMKHADKVIKRVLFLEGVPNLQRLAKVNVGERVVEQLELDLDNERRAVKMLNEGIELARSHGDNGTREMLDDILEDEEEHANWLEAQLELVKQVGEQNYLAEQIKKKDS